MSDTNRVRVAVARSSEVAIPISATVNELTQLRITGTPNLASAPQTIVSNEIRPDREISDLILTGVEAGGDIGFEQSFGALDLVTEAALFNNYGGARATPIVSSTADTVTLGAGEGSAGGWASDQIVRVEDAGAPGIYRIVSVATDVVTLIGIGGGTPVFNGAGTLTLAGHQVPSGVPVTFANNIVTFDLTTPALNFTAQPYNQVIGDWCEIAATGTAFTNAGNQGLARISNVANLTLSIEEANGGAETAPEFFVMFGQQIRPGSVSIPGSSLLVERAYTDHENAGVAGRYTRELFVGMAVNQYGEQLQPANIATATATLFGLRSHVRAANVSSELYADTDLAAIPFNADAGVTTGLLSVGANQVYNTASGVARIGRGDVDLVSPTETKNLVNELSMNLNNNLRRRLAVGRFGTASIGLGELGITGTLNTYFDDVSILNDVLQDGFRTSINWALRSGDGRGLLTDLPEVAFSSGAPDVPGKNADVTMAIGFQGLRDPNLGYSIQKTRFTYLHLSQ